MMGDTLDALTWSVRQNLPWLSKPLGEKQLFYSEEPEEYVKLEDTKEPFIGGRPHIKHEESNDVDILMVGEMGADNEDGMDVDNDFLNKREGQHYDLSVTSFNLYDEETPPFQLHPDPLGDVETMVANIAALDANLVLQGHAPFAPSLRLLVAQRSPSTARLNTPGVKAKTQTQRKQTNLKAGSLGGTPYVDLPLHQKGNLQESSIPESGQGQVRKRTAEKQPTPLFFESSEDEAKSTITVHKRRKLSVKLADHVDNDTVWKWKQELYCLVKGNSEEGFTRLEMAEFSSVLKEVENMKDKLTDAQLKEIKLGQVIQHLSLIQDMPYHDEHNLVKRTNELKTFWLGRF